MPDPPVPPLPAVAGADLATVPQLFWLVTAGQALIVFALGLMLAATVVFVRRRGGEAETRRIAILGATFLVAVLVTQLLLVGMLLHPGLAPAVFGMLSAAVAMVLALRFWPELRRLLDLPTRSQLTESNSALEGAVAERTRALEAVTQRFELALAASRITVFAQDADLRFTWLDNPREGLTPAAAGSAMRDEPESALALKRAALASGAMRSGLVSVMAADGSVSHFDLTASPARDAEGTITGVLCTAVDVTDRRLFEVQLAAMAARAATESRRFEMALEDSPITVFEQDAQLRYTFMHNPPRGTRSEDFLGRTDDDLLGEDELQALLPAKQSALQRGESGGVETDLTFAGICRFYAVRTEPKLDETGAVRGVIGTAVDLTERRRHEQNMRLVMRELTHRSKNLMAVVQAMARKTATGAPDTETFVRDFSSRLRAIAGAHDVLVAESWSGANLYDLLVTSLGQTLDPSAGGIVIEGPPVRLGPDASQMLALAFHEMTMNAVRHGALSVPAGKLAVRWVREDGKVRFRWIEEGGPPVMPPRRAGFGRLMIERLVGPSLDGTVSLEFRPGGLRCELMFPEARLGPA
jgi:two-component sensor histidine kinase/PAS domain-containing protein